MSSSNSESDPNPGREVAQRSSDGEEEVEGEEEGEEEEEEERANGHEEEQENGNNSQEDESGVKRSNSSTGNARSCKSSALGTLAFPISRVRRLVKSEADIMWVGVEAGFLIAKAAELFLEKFVEEAFDEMTEDEKTALSYKHLASHVSSSDRLDFLSDFIPETIPASVALSARGQADR